MSKYRIVRRIDYTGTDVFVIQKFKRNWLSFGKLQFIDEWVDYTTEYENIAVLISLMKTLRRKENNIKNKIGDYVMSDEDIARALKK